MRNIGNRIGKSITHAAASGGVFNTLQQFVFNVENLWRNDNGTIHLQGPVIRYNDLNLAPDTPPVLGPDKTPGTPYPTGPLGEDTPENRYNWTYYKGNYSYTILERPQTFTISGGGMDIDYFIVAGGGAGGCSVYGPVSDYDHASGLKSEGGGGGGGGVINGTLFFGEGEYRCQVGQGGRVAQGTTSNSELALSIIPGSGQPSYIEGPADFPGKLESIGGGAGASAHHYQWTNGTHPDTPLSIRQKRVAQPGGSGGGGCSARPAESPGTDHLLGAPGIDGQGKNGGNGHPNVSTHGVGGGGGGASSSPLIFSSPPDLIKIRAAGGTGIKYMYANPPTFVEDFPDRWGEAYPGTNGKERWFGGGGAGGRDGGASGGRGGGGPTEPFVDERVGIPGRYASGGGGGAGRFQPTTDGDQMLTGQGGPGIIILRYLT